MKLNKRRIRIVLMLLAFILIVPGMTIALANQEAAKHPAAETYQPTPVPDRIILTWTGDTATSQAVTWRTDDSVASPQAQIAKVEEGPQFKERTTTVLAGQTSEVKSNLGYTAKFHTVNFEGLKPSTQYVYRVGDGANWSEWMAFTTGSDRDEPFSFLYIGDAQNDIKEHWSRVIRKAYTSLPNASFIIHAGDLIDHGDADEQWGGWFEAAGWLNGMVPTIATPGNHEYSRITDTPRQLSEYWNTQFAFPANGPEGQEEVVTYWDYQGMRIISLDSNIQYVDFEAQLDWLEEILENNPNKWTVLTFHHPIFSSAEGRDNKELRDKLLPIIEKYSVDLVLQGHDHTYARGDKGDKGHGAKVYNADTVFASSVAGPKLYKLSHEVWEANGATVRSSAENIQLYQQIHVNGDVLSYEAYTATGGLYDRFEMRKLPNGKKQIKELKK